MTVKNKEDQNHWQPRDSNEGLALVTNCPWYQNLGLFMFSFWKEEQTVRDLAVPFSTHQA